MILDCGLRISECGFWNADFGMRIKKFHAMKRKVNRKRTQREDFKSLQDF